MKKNLYTLLSALLLLSALFVTGCKDDTTAPEEDKTVPNDVFPLTAGNSFEYSGYFTNQDTETEIPGTSSFYRTTWTILKADTPLVKVYGGLAAYIAARPNGKANSALILDSTLTTSGYRLTPVAAYYDQTSGDYFYLTNLGYFFKSQTIKDSANGGLRIDSLRFIKLASPKVGIGGSFTAFEESFMGYSNPLAPTTYKLTITGKWESKTDITVNGQKFSTYYLVVSRVVSVGTVSGSAAVTAKLWLAKGIGPVKMFLAGDAQTPGNYRELKTKNF